MRRQIRPRVVIVGAGFGGLWVVKSLAHSDINITVIDKNNYHTFFPLLYQVAAAELEPEDIIYPVRNFLRKYSNYRFFLGEVTRVDFEAQAVILEQGIAVPYDYLVLSLGSRAHFYNVPGAAEHAYPLKTLEHAILLRNQILCCFERAMLEGDAMRRKQVLTFVVVGGGPTGVEFTGALAELVHAPLKRDYPGLDLTQVEIVLLEGTDRLLSGLPDRLNTYAQERLQRMGVNVQLNSIVSVVTPHSVSLKDGRIIPTETVAWTAGIRGEALNKDWIQPLQPNGQVEVLPTLQLPGHPEVYLVGDLTHFKQDGHPLLQIAPVATQQGTWVARNIHKQMNGENPEAFRYRDPGMMVTIGRNAAAVQLAGHAFTGFIAWVIWLSVHLYKLIGFRNRLVVLLNWAWDYLFFERVVRLIMPIPVKRRHEEENA